MKQEQIIDFIFYGLALVVLILGGIELIKFLIPYYSYPKLLGVFVLLSIVYYMRKNKLSLADLSAIMTSDGKIPQRRILSEQKKHPLEYIFSIKKYISFHKNRIVYGGIIVVFLVVISSLFLEIGNLFPYSIGVFFAVYCIVKILGFQLQTHVFKSSIQQGNALRFFLIIFAIFIVAVSDLLREYDMMEDGKLKILLPAAVLFLIIGIYIFFDTGIKRQKIFSLYNVLSLVLISSLLGILIYKNIPEAEAPIEDIGEQNPIVGDPADLEPDILDAIVSDEVSLDEDPIIETRRVSQVYAINPGLGVGNTGGDVLNLQQVLSTLSYYTGAITGEYDESTRVSLRNALIGECDWPESTQGIFGLQAKDCIDNLEIPVIITE